MAKWKKLSLHIAGLITITLVSLCAISQAKHLGSAHKWFLVFALLMGASFIFESILTLKRSLVSYYKGFSLLTGVGLLTVVFYDSSINSYMYFVTALCLCFFFVKAAYLQFVLNSYELSPTSSRYQLEISCAIKDRKTEKYSHAKIVDISSTGCLIDCDTSLYPGELVYLDIHLKDKEVKTSARVIRHSNNPTGYGLQFVGLDRRKYSDFDEALKDILIDSGTISQAA